MSTKLTNKDLRMICMKVCEALDCMTKFLVADFPNSNRKDIFNILLELFLSPHPAKRKII